MRVKEIMVEDVQTITPADSADSAWNRMKLNRFHHLVVVEAGRVIGVISERDLGSIRGAAQRKNRTVGELMTPIAITGTPAMTIREVANLLRGRSIGCLPILQGRKLVGIITVSDLLELIGREQFTPRMPRVKPTRRMSGGAPRAERVTM